MKTRTIVARLCAVVALTLALSGANANAIVTSLSDITFWVGSGNNTAGLVVDFHDGSARQSFAWGYRWDGTASGADMILAITTADPGLSMVAFGTGASDFFLTEISFLDGMDLHTQTSGSFATYPADYSSWGYYIAGGSAGGAGVSGGGLALPTTWTSSPTAASLMGFGSPGRELANNSWDAWSFGLNSPSYEHTVPPGSTVFAAVPEPRVTTLIVLALSIVFYARKRLHSC